MICPWALKDEFLKTYHDEEWCRPHHDDTYLFEMLVLEGAQAGLSWSTILKRREGYRKTFFHFDISRCAGMTDEEMEEIGRTAPVIRNRRKINSVRQNARAVLAIQKEWGSFSRYLWYFTENKIIVHHLQDNDDLPASSPLSEKISADLKKRGCTFAGPVIIYSFLQAAGIINDHLESCPSRSTNRT